MATRQKQKSEASMRRTLDAALELFSSRGFGATSMRQIADAAELSVGNVYHHFASKEEIFERLLEEYWERVTDPALELNRIFARADFPDDLEAMAAAIEEVVETFRPYILLIYVDVIEFRGEHIRSFYEGMAGRFEQAYADRLRERQRSGELSDEIDPLVAVMTATRWFFYFYTVEKCFGVPMHLGMAPDKAVPEFIRLLRHGLLPRRGEADGGDSHDARHLPAVAAGPTTKGET